MPFHDDAVDGHIGEKSPSSVHRERAAIIEEEGFAQEFDQAETSEISRKIDYRLLPILSFLYLLAFLDRSNLGNAKVAGLADDLELTGEQYNLAATVLFTTYCLLEIPANIMLKILPPSRRVVAWGTMILDLGYTAAQAQLLTIPVYVAATVSLLICSRLADRRQTRWPFIVFPYMLALVGFIGMLATPQDCLPGLAYFFLFPITMGCYPGVITVVTWIANNISLTSKRAIGKASTLMMANLGGVIGSNIFLAAEAPRYWTGYGTCADFLTLAIGCTIFLRAMYVRENRKRDQWTEEEVRAKYTEEELLDMGDRSPLYRYVC